MTTAYTVFAVLLFVLLAALLLAVLICGYKRVTRADETFEFAFRNLPGGEPCIGCHRCVTTHPSRLCEACRSDAPDAARA